MRTTSVRYFRDRLRVIFQLNDAPHKLAAAFAAGVFIAFSPTIGLHMISCLVVAWMFRLSKLVVLTAAFLNNPWTMVPMYGFCLWFGIRITGSTIESQAIDWNALTVRSAYELLKPYLWPFIAGTVVIGLAAAVLSYGIIYWAVVKYRKGDAIGSLPGGNGDGG